MNVIDLNKQDDYKKNATVIIAVVDDSKDDHFFITEALRESDNVSLLHFYDPELFLNYLKRNEAESKKPDIVILDINMPKLTGFELYEEVLINKLKGQIKFCILTTTISDADTERGKRLKLNCFLKPFSIHEYTEVLNEIISSHI